MAEQHETGSPKHTATAATSDAPAAQNDLEAALVDPTLVIAQGDPGFSLTLLEKGLRVQGSVEFVTADPKCGRLARGRPPLNQIILYYNILWAAFDDNNTLHISIAANASKKRLKCLEFAYNIPLLSESQRPTIDAWVESLLTRSYGSATRNKRAYVLINPHAGRGDAMKIWTGHVRPLFEAARMHLEEVRTTQTGHARALVQQLDLDNFDTVVACSGDGLPNEIFNGLARRADARRALASLAVCQIPCGSGNAMSCNMNGTHYPSLAALAIIKGLPTPLDLISVTHGNTRELSFLSQSLGIVADLDLGTEWLRWMGQQRFVLGFLWLVMLKKKYPCDLAVKVEIEKQGVRTHYRDYIYPSSGSESVVEEDNGNGPDPPSGQSDDRTPSVGDSPRPAGGQSDDPIEQAVDNGDGPDPEAAVSDADDDQGLPPLRFGTVKDKIPDDWQLISLERLGNFYCGNMKWMTPDANFFSAALPNDGLMDLIIINGDIHRGRAIELQLSLESGRFFDNPRVSYRKISAYRITPRNVVGGGNISIDGERLPFQPFQAEVHPGLGLTLSKSGRWFEGDGPLNWQNA